jgi:hypothetical protein
VDLLKRLDVGDPFLLVGNDIVFFDTRNGVVVLEVAVSVLMEGFITSHPYSGEVVSIARTIIGRLVVGCEEARQSCPGGDALCWEIVEPQEWSLPITSGKYPAMWSSLPPEARAAMLYILSHILGSERPSYFSIAGLKSFGYLIVQRRREKAGKLLSRRDDVEVVRRAIVLVVLSTSQEFLDVHDPKFCSLNGVVGVKGVWNPVFAVVVCTSSYLHFISYAVTLASFCTISLD